MEIPYPRLKLVVQISSRTNPPLLTWPGPLRWGYAWETTTSEFSAKPKHETNTDFINVHLAKTETALKASWPQLVASFLGRVCCRHRLSLRLFPSSARTDFPPAPWSTEWPECVGHTLSSLSALRESWDCPCSPCPWPAHPRAGTGQWHSPAWSPGR